VLHFHPATAAPSLPATGQVEGDASLQRCLGQQSADLDFNDLA
jgi:hypothetical protein